MPSDFLLPEVAEGVDTAEVGAVLIAAGEAFDDSTMVVTVETDKASVDVPSNVAGKVVEIKVQPGDTVRTGEVLFTYEPAEGGADGETGTTRDAQPTDEPIQAGEPSRPGEPKDPQRAAALDADAERREESSPPSPNGAGQSPAPQTGPPATAQPAAATAAASPGSAADQAEAPGKEPAAPQSAGASGRRPPVFASPAVRSFAREIGIDIYEVTGSGPGGRISEEDVKAHARAGGAGRAAASAAQPATTAVSRPVTAPAAPAAPELPDFSIWGEVKREKLSKIKRATAAHMSLAWTTIPHVTLHQKVDVTELEALRQRLKPKVERSGSRLTVTVLLVKLVVWALKRYPLLNASLDLSAGEVIHKQYHHIGVAVDTERGLVVPVVRDADQKDLATVAAELGELASQARAGKLQPDQMQGATFTVTNLGSLGTGFFTPIINHPEVAILGVGLAQEEPVWLDETWQPRLMMPLSLSHDHRLVDGADGARFLSWLQQAIEDPLGALVD